MKNSHAGYGIIPISVKAPEPTERVPAPPSGVDLESEGEPERGSSSEPELAEQVAEVVERAELLLKSEALDAAWSGESLQQIRSAFTGLPGSRLLQAECRATLCRVQVEHDSPSLQRDLPTHISQLPPFSGGCLYRPSTSSGGFATTTLYVSRAGHRLGG